MERFAALTGRPTLASWQCCVVTSAVTKPFYGSVSDGPVACRAAAVTACYDSNKLPAASVMAMFTTLASQEVTQPLSNSCDSHETELLSSPT
jgi:hypothetical protein